MPKLRWTIALKEPLRDRQGRELRTLADGRDYMLALPKTRQQESRWQHAAQTVLAAAAGGDVAAASIALKRALFLDGNFVFTK